MMKPKLVIIVAIDSKLVHHVIRSLVIKNIHFKDVLPFRRPVYAPTTTGINKRVPVPQRVGGEETGFRVIGRFAKGNRSVDLLARLHHTPFAPVQAMVESELGDYCLVINGQLTYMSSTCYPHMKVF